MTKNQAAVATIAGSVEQFAGLLARGAHHHALRFAEVARDRLRDAEADEDLLADDGLLTDEAFTAELLIKSAMTAARRNRAWEFACDAKTLAASLHRQLADLRQRLAH